MAAFALLALLMLVTGASAHSVRPPPLRRLHHPSRSGVRVVPRGGGGTVLTPRSTISPPPHELRHDDSLLLSIMVPSLSQQEIALLLEPSQNLFHPDATITYESGNQQPLRASDWRLYQGKVVRPEWIETVWAEEMGGVQHSPDAFTGFASVMVHESSADHVRWEGSFNVQGVTYQVMTREKYEMIKEFDDVDVSVFGSDMVIFSNQDGEDAALDALVPRGLASAVRSNASWCGHDSLDFNLDPLNPARKRSNILFARDDLAGATPETNYIDSIGSPAGCPRDPQIVYVGVAMDCNYISRYGDAERAREQVLANMNQVTTLYRKTFNISIGLIHLEARDGPCPAQAVPDIPWNVNCSDSISLNDRLSTFSQWRAGRGDDGAGLWHLMTACSSDTEVGVAWLGTLCSQGSRQADRGQYVSGTGVSSAARTEWNIVAHEIGHNFGAIHDCGQGCNLQSGCCPFSRNECDARAQFIMNPTTADSETEFSPCTLGNICSFIGTGSFSCIMTPDGRTTIGKNQCGNGIVEEGEECDPGGEGPTACCTSECKLAEGAVCDPTNAGCCTSECQFASQGTVCRASIDETCDMEEVCTGTNATCPADETAEDGTSCGNGLACASGHCTSNDLQCQQAGRAYGLSEACPSSDDSCYVACRTPNMPQQCTVLQTVLLDGSPCGYGGHCYRGNCRPGSWQNRFSALYTQNLQYSIPITVVVGLIVLAILYSILRCCCGCCGGRTRKQKHVPVPPPPPMMANYPRQQGPTDPRSAPAHTRTPSGSYSDEAAPLTTGDARWDPYGARPGGLGAPPPPRGGNAGWVDETIYNGPHTLDGAYRGDMGPQQQQQQQMYSQPHGRWGV